MKIFEEKLKEISELSQNWDGYDSPPIHKNIIRKCQKIFSLFPENSYDYLIPTTDESVLLQFKKDDIFFKFEITKDETALMIKRNEKMIFYDILDKRLVNFLAKMLDDTLR